MLVQQNPFVILQQRKMYLMPYLLLETLKLMTLMTKMDRDFLLYIYITFNECEKTSPQRGITMSCRWK